MPEISMGLRRVISLFLLPLELYRIKKIPSRSKVGRRWCTVQLGSKKQVRTIIKASHRLGTYYILGTGNIILMSFSRSSAIEYSTTLQTEQNARHSKQHRQRSRHHFEAEENQRATARERWHVEGETKTETAGQESQSESK